MIRVPAAAGEQPAAGCGIRGEILKER